MNTTSQVLIVEDNDDLREAMVIALSQLGFENVTVAVNGQDALNKLSEQPANLVISDLQMPGMDGIGLLATMKKDVPLACIPFILVSVSLTQEAEKKALGLGAFACLPKWDIMRGEESFRNLVQRALETK